jgi:hypothetical protein
MCRNFSAVQEHCPPEKPFANHQSPFAAALLTLSQNFRQPLNGFCDFAPFGIQFLRVTLVIGLAADETVKGR